MSDYDVNYYQPTYNLRVVKRSNGWELQQMWRKTCGGVETGTEWRPIPKVLPNE